MWKRRDRNVRSVPAQFSRKKLFHLWALNILSVWWLKTFRWNWIWCLLGIFINFKKIIDIGCVAFFQIFWIDILQLLFPVYIIGILVLKHYIVFIYFLIIYEPTFRLFFLQQQIFLIVRTYLNKFFKLFVSF